jgi:NAD-dependent DNA ligase
MTALELFFEDPYNFLQNANIKDLVEIAKQADIAYYNNDEPIMSDDEYDMIIDRINTLDPNNSYLKKVGAPVTSLTQTITSKNKVNLPYTMGSMNKIRPENIDIINNFKNKYLGPWIISDKLDGVSALLIIDPITKKNNLYTRGNGIIGTDITNLLDIINLNIPTNIKTKIVIRGELIISKTKFKKYSSTMANARNMVSGIVNAKTIDISKAKDVDFIGYEVVEPWSSYLDQFKLMNKYKIPTVYYTITNDLSVDNLSKLLKERKSESDYECDGIIITYNSPDQRVSIGNPEYAFAFKNLAELETAIVTVKQVEWNVSKDGYLKPKLILNPTKLSGVIIKNVTAFNAKYIVDNSIGPGTQIKLVRSGDVIPHILEIVKKSKNPSLPEDSDSYEWNDTNVDIITKEGSTEQKIKELTFFCSKLDVKNVSEGIIAKFIEVGIDTIPKILSVTKSELAEVENFKDKMINKIYETIHTKAKEITLLDLMVASNSFGHGMGERKIKKILEVYPDIIYLYIEKEPNILIKMIKEIDGFDTITATQFITKMKNFLELLHNIRQDIQERIMMEIPKQELISLNLKGVKIVFSGFRNKDWEKIIQENGGEISTTISKNTTILVSTIQDIEAKTNSKIIKALDLGIKILSKEQFEKDYINK